MTGINSVRQQNCVTKISMQPNITQKKKKDELNKVLMCIYRQLKYSKQNTCYITSYKPIEYLLCSNIALVDFQLSKFVSCHNITCLKSTGKSELLFIYF